jgi:hypothetical protein
MRRSAPPYAKPLLRRRQDGVAPLGYLVIACDWKTWHALHRQADFGWIVCCAAIGEAKDWSIAAGLDCLLVGPPKAIEFVITQLIPYRPRSIHFDLAGEFRNFDTGRPL